MRSSQIPTCGSYSWNANPNVYDRLLIQFEAIYNILYKNIPIESSTLMGTPSFVFFCEYEANKEYTAQTCDTTTIWHQQSIRFTELA